MDPEVRIPGVRSQRDPHIQGQRSDGRAIPDSAAGAVNHVAEVVILMFRPDPSAVQEPHQTPLLVNPEAPLGAGLPELGPADGPAVRVPRSQPVAGTPAHAARAARADTL